MLVAGHSGSGAGAAVLRTPSSAAFAAAAAARAVSGAVVAVVAVGVVAVGAARADLCSALLALLALLSLLSLSLLALLLLSLLALLLAFLLALLLARLSALALWRCFCSFGAVPSARLSCCRCCGAVLTLRGNRTHGSSLHGCARRSLGVDTVSRRRRRFELGRSGRVRVPLLERASLGT